MSSAVNFNTLFQKPVKYEEPPRIGFILHPHDDSNPDGWGDPLVDAAGNSIFPPGTPGGKNPNRFLYYRDGEWKSSRSGSKQVAGPIDWKGPYEDPTAPRLKRYVLSYWGPNSRHFNDGNFQYDADDKHFEIYVEGKLLTLAPGPVLGAAIKLLDVLDDAGNVVETQKYIVVICKDGNGDEVYARQWISPPLPYADVTDQDRVDMKQKADAAHPHGWFSMGGFPQQVGAVTPETPWFFNQSCTEARCVRRTAFTFDNGAGSVTEDAMVEYFCRITFNETYKTVLFTNIGKPNGDRFTYREQVEKYRRNWVFATTHDWQEDIYESYLQCSGQMLVAVDYREDVPIRAWWTQKMTNYVIRIWELGIDDVGEPSSNNGRTDGEAVSHAAGVIFATLPGYRQTGVWAAVSEEVNLVIGNVQAAPDLTYRLQYSRAGSKSFFQSGENSNSDQLRYFWTAMYNYLHHLDLRELYLVGYTDGVENFYRSTDGYRFTTIENAEWMQPNTGYTDPYANAAPDKGNMPFIWAETRRTSGAAGPPIEGWTRAEMLTWPTTITQDLNRTTYLGGWPDPNAGEAIYAPDYWTSQDPAMDLPETYVMRVWPIARMLYSDRAYREKLVCGVDENKNFLCHLKYDNIGPSSERIVSRLSPDGDLATTMVYGTEFSPGGVT